MLIFVLSNIFNFSIYMDAAGLVIAKETEANAEVAEDREGGTYDLLFSKCV